MDRREFLTRAGLGLGGAIIIPTLSPATGQAAEKPGTRSCPCGCGAGPIKPNPLPAIEKAHNTVNAFSPSGTYGVGGVSKLGAVTILPALWRRTPTGMTITALDPMDPKDPASASCVNDAGTSVGYSKGKPLQWSVDGKATILPLGGASRGQAIGLSNAGHVVGNLSIKGTAQACTWIDGELRILTVPGARQSSVRSVNSMGQSCGAVESGGRWQPMLWNGTKATALPLNKTFSGGVANFIADNGTVVGEVYHARTMKAQAAAWIGGQLVTVGPTTGTSTATGVSSDGRVIGDYVGPDKRRRAFVARGTHWMELAANSVLATAKSISSSGVVSGSTALTGLAIPVTWTTPALTSSANVRAISPLVR